MDMSGEKKQKLRRWTRDTVLFEIRALPNFSAKRNQRSFPSLYGAAIRHFGSWRNAVEASGINYELSLKRKAPGYWNRERVVQAIRILSEKSSVYVRKEHADLYSAGLRVFGGWKEAVEAAGFDYGTVRKIYRDQN